MANALITPQVITQEALRILHNKSALIGRVNRDYQDMFAKNGGKVGTTINIRKPPMFTIRSGPVANIQDVTETTIPLTIQPEFGIDFQFSDFDLTLTVDKFSKRYIEPAAKRLATELDMRIVQAMFKATGNSVGTPGTSPTSQQAAQQLVLNAGKLLTDNAADLSDRMFVMNTGANVSLLSQLNLGFNNQAKIGEQYNTGLMGANTLGFDFYQSQNMPVQTVGPLGGTPLVNGAGQGTINTGTTDNPSPTSQMLITDGWTAAAAARLVQGDSLTIGGVFAVNPETKQTTGQLMQFVVTGPVSSDSAGNAVIPISPAIVAGGAFQNVTNRPADNAAITINGAGGGMYPVSLAFVKDAFTLATVDMELPKGIDMADQAEADGVSIRFVRGFDIVNNRRICRFDMMAGFGAVRPEWATRVYC